MTETQQMECDAVVIGGGMAGMIAAVRAAQGGLRVAVLEKQPEDQYLCNSRLTAGVWHCCATDILADPDLLYSKIMEATGGAAQEALARAIIQDGPRVVRWMRDVGVRFIKGPYAYQSFVLSPPSVTPQGCEWRGRGGDLMLRTLEAELLRLGSRLHRGHRAVSLEQENGRVVGLHGERVVAKGEGFERFRVNAGAVVIADGGFQSDPERLRQSISPRPDDVFQRNARTGLGEGLRMAEAAGAATTRLDGFYGHVLSRDVFHNDRLWPYPYLDYLATAGVVVDKHGRRFTDEGQGGVAIANAIAASDDPLDKFTIADQRIWDECGVVRLVSPNPFLRKVGATLYEAPTVQALAQQCGLAPEPLLALIREYNAAVSAENTAALTPPRSNGKYPALPIEAAPFYAFPVCAGITYTMGGLSINADAQVLAARDAAPIPGLYAVGCSTGGLEGGGHGGYIGGLLKSSVTALRAAEHIVGRGR